MILILLVAYVLFLYNSLVRSRNKISQAKSTIDVYLTQRFDLIPNLVECVKGYMKHEKEVFEKITEMRKIYNEKKDLKEGEVLNNECNRIIAISEQYPELKASENFLDLQKKLAKMESQLQAARRIYNGEVNIYNNKVQTFPSNILANIFSFKEEEYFEAETVARENIKI